jgi:4-amino-4-deoxy-L-arabinose transferase-like glycosyltransferase
LAAGVAGVMLWPGRAGLPPIDRDESRYAQATRQMLESGDLLDLRYQDQPRYVQPVGAYWLQAVAVRLAGQAAVRTIWPHRLPSLLAGIMSVAFTASIGLRLFAAPVALAGAGLLAGSLLFNFEARIATTDACLLACILAGQYGLLRIWQGRAAPASSTGAAALFWVALGSSVMMKGPAGVLVLGSTAIAVAGSQRRWGWLRRLQPGWGVPLALAIVLPWMVAIGVRTGGAFFAQAVGHNMLGKMSQAQEAHGAPPGIYVLLFLLSFWPGSLLAVQALPGVWASRRQDAVRYLLSWIVPTWLVFECLPTKLPHYVMPTYPAIALLAVAGCAAPASRAWQRWGFSMVAVAWLAVGAAVALGPAALLWYLTGTFDAVGFIAGLLGAGLIALMLWLALSGRRLAAGLCGVAAALVVNATAFGRVLPEMSPIWLSPRVARLVRAVQPCPGSILVSGNYNEPSLVFLLGTATRLTDPVTAANALIKDPACALALIGDQGLAAFDATLAGSGAAAEELGSVAGVDYSNGRRLDLHLFRLQPHPG